MRGVNSQRVSSALDGDISIECSPALGDAQRALQQPVVKWFRKRHGNRLARAGRRCGHPPCGHRQRAFDRGTSLELVAEFFLERQPVTVAPLALDKEGVAASRLERAAHLPVRQDAALDASGIEEDGVTRAIVVPEIRVERQEGVHDLLAAIVEQRDVVVAAPPVHRRREMKIHAQLIGRHQVPRWKDLRDDGGGRARDSRRADDRGDSVVRQGVSAASAGRRPGSSTTSY